MNNLVTKCERMSAFICEGKFLGVPGAGLYAIVKTAYPFGTSVDHFRAVFGAKKREQEILMSCLGPLFLGGEGHI